MTQPSNQIRWRSLNDRIKKHKVTPFVSDRVGCDPFLVGEAPAQAWATLANYPIKTTRSITRVAQYKSVLSDDLEAKLEYLDLMKGRLLEMVRERKKGNENAFLETLQADLSKEEFSTIASRLKYPSFDDEPINPLRILAELPLKVYVTTSYHSYLAEALRATNVKEPQVDFCRWKSDLEEFPSPFNDDYEPTVDKPLVYHLHGLDTIPESLVLTEDDYLDFLVWVTREPEAIPLQILPAMTHSTLLLLGYDLQEWDFRVLFRGLIKRETKPRLDVKNISIQLMPGEEQAEESAKVQKFLEKYFDDYNFNVYWGNSESFMRELWEQWQSQG